MYLAVPRYPLFSFKKRARSIYLTLIYLSIPTLKICGTKAKKKKRKKKGKKFSSADDDILRPFLHR